MSEPVLPWPAHAPTQRTQNGSSPPLCVPPDQGDGRGAGALPQDQQRAGPHHLQHAPQADGPVQRGACGARGRRAPRARVYTGLPSRTPASLAAQPSSSCTSTPLHSALSLVACRAEAQRPTEHPGAVLALPMLLRCLPVPRLTRCRGAHSPGCGPAARQAGRARAAAALPARPAGGGGLHAGAQGAQGEGTRKGPGRGLRARDGTGSVGPLAV